jgi:hypothetical protein
VFDDPGPEPWIRESRIVTFAALTLTKPWISRPDNTVPALVIVMSCHTGVRARPAGTPVFAEVGIPVPGLGVVTVFAVQDESPTSNIGTATAEAADD